MQDQHIGGGTGAGSCTSQRVAWEARSGSCESYRVTSFRPAEPEVADGDTDGFPMWSTGSSQRRDGDDWSVRPGVPESTAVGSSDCGGRFMPAFWLTTSDEGPDGDIGGDGSSYLLGVS